MLTIVLAAHLSLAPTQVWQIAPVDQHPPLRRDSRTQRPVVGFIIPDHGAPITLPEQAVLNEGGGAFVYVIGEDDRIVRRYVTIGRIDDAGVTILRGIEGRERVVLEAGPFLNPGEQVLPEHANTPGSQPE